MGCPLPRLPPRGATASVLYRRWSILYGTFGRQGRAEHYYWWGATPHQTEHPCMHGPFLTSLSGGAAPLELFPSLVTAPIIGTRGSLHGFAGRQN